MPKLSHRVLVLFAFLFVFGIRVYFAAQHGTFSSDESYYVLRQAEHIKATLTPIYNDPLSYGGKFVSFLPTYHYIIAGLSFFGSNVLKLFSALVGASIVVVAYLIAADITKHKYLAVLGGLFAGLVPAFLKTSLNSLTPKVLTLVLFFVCVYYVIKIEKARGGFSLLLLFSVLLSLVSPIALLLVLVLWVYSGLLKLQKLKLRSKSFEYMLFLTFLTITFNQLALSKLGLEWGILGLISGVPSSLLKQELLGLSWVGIISSINAILLLLGVYGAYIAVQKWSEKREVSLLLSVCIVFVVAVMLRFVDLTQAVSYLGVTFAIMSVYTFGELVAYIKKLKLRLPGGLLTMLILTLIALPVLGFGLYEANSQAEKAIPNYEIRGLLWLANNSEEDVCVLAPLELGHLVTYFAKRRVIADTNFINSKDIEERLRDIALAYTTPYETNAIEIFDKYGVGYIFLSPRVKNRFGIDKPSYVADAKCFEMVYNQTVQIYKVKCTLK
ncbi:hypothetical protein DRJ48_01250 [Candidatus Woesearchaeota archaeon]|nr:hypothetical protein [Candidatus Woesearchaeota archaeon]RLE43333.1 MAG: hypothetical protein DRJ48_01250 [Candidatus Woesearchaeota archaeon]